MTKLMRKLLHIIFWCHYGCSFTACKKGNLGMPLVKIERLKHEDGNCLWLLRSVDDQLPSVVGQPSSNCKSEKSLTFAARPLSWEL